MLEIVQECKVNVFKDALELCEQKEKRKQDVKGEIQWQ